MAKKKKKRPVHDAEDARDRHAIEVRVAREGRKEP